MKYHSPTLLRSNTDRLRLHRTRKVAWTAQN